MGLQSKLTVNKLQDFVDFCAERNACYCKYFSGFEGKFCGLVEIMKKCPHVTCEYLATNLIFIGIKKEYRCEI